MQKKSYVTPDINVSEWAEDIVTTSGKLVAWKWGTLSDDVIGIGDSSEFDSF